MLFINAPLDRLTEGVLDFFCHHGLQPEIGCNPYPPWGYDHQRCAHIAHVLAGRRLSCTLHAPFRNLDPGSRDPAKRHAAWQAINGALELAPIFKPKALICHPHLVSAPASDSNARLHRSLDFWRPLLHEAQRLGVAIHFENTYEPGPEILLAFLQRLPPAREHGLCLDVGHIHAFTRSHWRQWLPLLLPYLRQLHIHDNDGTGDQHLPPGNGSFDFPGLFSFLHQRRCRPLITLEPHQENDLLPSVASLATIPSFTANYG